VLSGSEQNPDLAGKDIRKALAGRGGMGATAPIEAFKTTVSTSSSPAPSTSSSPV
jgi:predicted oxidoreductase